MRRVWMAGVMACGLAGSVAALTVQRATGTLEWLPAAEARSPDGFTLLVVEEGTGHPVDRPLACQDPDGGWMLGGPDGRLSIGGNVPDTLRLRVLGPLHDARAITVPWSAARGRTARLALPRRISEAQNPSCE